MIPRIQSKSRIGKDCEDFLRELSERGFRGEIDPSYPARLLGATDNSVYQCLPQAVVFPADEDDVALLMALGHEERHQGIRFAPRGGGTGTNGQSLNAVVQVDLSRHLRRTSGLDPKSREIFAEAGVIKDELNEQLAPHGLFFSPELSTSSRATLGGMISNDAAGQGSLRYGRTSDHTKSLRMVLLDGTVAELGPVSGEGLQSRLALPGMLGDIYRGAHALLTECAPRVAEVFPRLNRFLTGYDLAHAYDPKSGTLNLARLVCGAEGTLGIVTGATLDLTATPRYRALLNIKYSSFDAALRHATFLIDSGVFSVETVDSNVFELAKRDAIWFTVRDYIHEVEGAELKGINIVEFSGMDAGEERGRMLRMQELVAAAAARGEGGILGVEAVETPEGIAAVYGMRKKAVGLLGAAAGRAKRIAFTEDTAVPPRNLADYIADFRALLDGMGVPYGMFGHVDTGVMHVRPALDLTQEGDREKFVRISNEVVALVERYGGQMWGEHGRGHRACFGKVFFKDLYPVAQKIKALFDPHNRMNPGKICAPYGSDAPLVSLEGPLRADLDRTVPLQIRDDFAGAFDCNGNGQCFSYSPKALMCPNYRHHQDRVRSPKGYAALLREWLRIAGHAGVDASQEEREAARGGLGPVRFLRRALNTLGSSQGDFSAEIERYTRTCLSCKSCKSQCPAHVNAAELNSRFLSLYYGRYLRPRMDLAVLNAERVIPLLSHFPALANAALGLGITSRVVESLFGLIDLPRFSSRPLGALARAGGLMVLSAAEALRQRPEALVVADPFTAAYEADGVVALARLLRALGTQVAILAPHANGKLQVIRGDRHGAARLAAREAERLQSLYAAGIALVGFDPALTLCYRDEYVTLLGERRGDFCVQLPEEWLQGVVSAPGFSAPARGQDREPYYLFCHCTEQALLPASVRMWQEVFRAFSIDLIPEPVSCCGMAGLHGHMAEHREETYGVYRRNWQGRIRARGIGRSLVTGFSCRSQVQRMEGQRPRHPCEALLEALGGAHA
ncbi:MAG: FAD-binding oxidoreductase [Succinivibrionaceae bacterium]|nr:FAD-binding oxidoreductase [Succinivibrionaceae bacterium]